MTEKHLNIDHVSMIFDTPAGPFTALENVDLVISKGEYVSLIGHSGCGKSTVLNVVAGLLKASTGGVVLDGTEVDEPGPERAAVPVRPPERGPGPVPGQEPTLRRGDWPQR